MKMPFEGLSLLDYAINTSLVLCNVCLYRQDKFGLVSFSHKPGQVLPAEKKASQLNNVLESLYRLETEFLESHAADVSDEIARSAGVAATR